MKPSRALLALVAGLFALALLLGALPALGVDLPAQLQPLWWGLLCALVLLALLDAIWLHRLPSPRLERALPGNLALGRWSDVRLTLHHGYQRSLIVDVFDQVPAAMDFEPLPQQVALHPGEHTEFGYRVRPLKRGHFHFPACELQLPSPWACGGTNGCSTCPEKPASIRTSPAFMAPS